MNIKLIKIVGLSFLIIMFNACASNGSVEKTVPDQIEQSELTNYAVAPKAIPFSETVFGIELDDPYRWMEKKEHQVELLDWMTAAGQHTYTQLKELPGRQRLLTNLLKAMTGDITIRSVNVHNDLIYFVWGDIGADNYSLYVSERPGHKREIFNPLSVAEKSTDTADIQNYSISPNGKKLAVHVGLNGEEIGRIYFVDIKSGEISDYSIGPVWGEFPASWLDEDTVTVTKISNLIENDPLQGMQTSIYDLISRTSKTLLGYKVDPKLNFEKQYFPLVSYEFGTDWLIGVEAGARADSGVLLKKLNELESSWIRLASFDDNINGAYLVGDSLYLQTSKNAPNGKVLKLDLSQSTSLVDAKTLVPERADRKINYISASSESLYISYNSNGVDSVDYLNHGSNTVKSLNLPDVGGLSMYTSVQSKNVVFRLSSPEKNNEYIRYSDNKFSSTGLSQNSYKLEHGLQTERTTAISADGTVVPVTIFKSGDMDGLSPRPAHIFGYGGYGISISSRYRPYLFAWLEEGGIYVNCHTRGGGEKGRKWYEDGKGKNKKNGHADFIACAEKLIEMGYTTSDLLTAGSGSMGGTLLGPTLVKRPDLFKAAYLSVAVLNTIRILEKQNGMNQIAEIGDPRTEEGFKQLYDMDTYQFMQNNDEVPDILFPVGLNDQRVSPWNTGKVLAYLNANKPETLALVRSSTTGHGVGGSNNDDAERFADIYSFLLNRVGHPDFQLQQK